MARDGTDRKRATWRRVAMDIGLLPVDLAMDFLLRPLMRTPAGAALFPSKDSPTGGKPSWRPYGDEPFWYPRAWRADLLEDRINGGYMKLKDRALAEVPLTDLAERKRRADAIEARRRADIAAYRAGGLTDVPAAPKQDLRQGTRAAEASSKAATTLGKAVHGYASALPGARMEILKGLPPHVAGWLAELPESALWEMKHVGPTACGRMALGQDGVLQSVPRCLQPEEIRALDPNRVYYDEAQSKRAERVAGGDMTASGSEPPFVRVEGTGGVDSVTAAQAREFRRLDPTTVQSFLDREAMRRTGMLAGLSAEQVRVLREIHPIVIDRFVAAAERGQSIARTLGTYLKPEVLQARVVDANARARVASPASGGMGILAGVTPAMVRDFLGAAPEALGPVPGGKAPSSPSGLTTEQVKVMRELGQDFLVMFASDPRVSPVQSLGSFASPFVLAAAIERAGVGAAHRPGVAGPEVAEEKSLPVVDAGAAPSSTTPLGNVGDVPVAEGTVEALSDGVAAVPTSVEQPVLDADEVEPLRRAIGDTGGAEARPAGEVVELDAGEMSLLEELPPATVPERRRVAIPGRPLGTDVELELAFGRVADVIDEARRRMPDMDDAGRAKLAEMETNLRNSAIMGVSIGRTEFPGLPQNFGLEAARAGLYKDLTDIDFTSGVPPVGDAVQRYAAASPEDRGRFRGMPPHVKQWLDGMSEESLFRLATSEVSDVDRTAYGVDAGIPGVEPCPLPPPGAGRELRRDAVPVATVASASGDVSSSMGKEITASVAGATGITMGGDTLAGRLGALRAATAGRVDPAIHERNPHADEQSSERSLATDAKAESPSAPVTETVKDAVVETMEEAPKVSGSLLRERIGNLAAKGVKPEPDLPEPAKPEVESEAKATEEAVAALIAAKVKDAPATGGSAIRSRLNLMGASRMERPDPANFEKSPEADEDHVPEESGPARKFG